MPFAEKTYLPSYEELTVPEIELTLPALKAASVHMGKYCDFISKEFMLCRDENGNDPRPCLNEGKEVTRCGMEFLQKVKKNCAESFTNYWKCLDKCHRMELKPCRKYQYIFDKCMEEKMSMSRPEIGYFMKIRLHDTVRPKPTEPALPEEKVYEETHKEPRSKFYQRYGFGR